MPAKPVRNGLYHSNRTKTFHYFVRIGGKVHAGDTGEKTRAKALKFLAKYRTRVAEETGGTQNSAVPTLDEALDRWARADAGTLTAKHIHERQACLRRHCKNILDIPLDKIDTAKVDHIRSTYLAGKWTGPNWKSDPKQHVPGGWNKLKKHLYGIVNWCVDREMLAARTFKAKSIKVQDPLRPTLWPEKAADFLKSLDSATKTQGKRTAARLMLQLGLRENEALNARWEGFDERQGTYRPGKTKNREVREIALPPGLLDYLRRHHPISDTGLILANGRKPYERGYTKDAVSRAGRAIGVVGLHPHSLRATFATAHWELGTPLSQIQAMLGHKTPGTTMGYIRQRSKDASEAQAKVAAAMGLDGTVI
jgi:integrase